jgi:hypothetical protein
MALIWRGVDIPCLLKIITNIFADPNAKKCLATDAAATASNGAHAGPDSGGAAIDNGDEGDFSSEPPTSAAADSLFLMKQTGAALNSTFLATQFTAYQAALAEQP